MPRLSTCMEPLVNICPGQGDGPHAPPYVYGLLSAVERHNIASIAERLGQSRLPLQGFMGWPEGDDEPWRQEVRRQGQTPWGPGDGVRGCDPSGFPTSGRESVGGARQWGGRLGTVDPCQGAMYWGYVSRQGPPWWTPACPCPQHGRRPRPVSPKRACRKGPEATAGVTSWPGRGWHKTAPVCPIAGVLVMPRGGAALLVSASPGGRGGAVWVGGAVAHAETCSGGRAPRVERPGTSVQASLAPGRGVESIACGGALAQDRGARWVQRPSGG
jgi:hypothetical protein